MAASPTPHAEILEQCVPILAEQGIELVINEYSDYVVPNTAVEDGDEDANYFQHLPYLEEFNETRGTHLVSVAGVHIEPMGIYAGQTASLEDLPDGAVIAIPNDATNEGRALLLLEAQGLITLDDSSNLTATPNNIVDNPKNLEFQELEAPTIPSVLAGRGPGGHQLQLRPGRRPEPHHGRPGHRVQRLPLRERAGGEGGQRGQRGRPGPGGGPALRRHPRLHHRGVRRRRGPRFLNSAVNRRLCRRAFGLSGTAFCLFPMLKSCKIFCRNQW